ncbi:FAD/NAD(P)-binding domain-containing protein [Rhizopogon vinicolor AM-OR11-026]|uniref:FAD/NAD(P)-binding domain-containing protein n=1 Tax=Rhizopogon vinicolor AM-OR11-026 TaxID=1314800 RepID=A0A1B7NBM8_9AGAM|nr:FAD/NAD(P)-binding domain-containing protein [Rhizopogon vinicolor AM-OR11-026]
MSPSSSTPKFRVAICGTGIGGLTLAVTIAKFAERDIQVDMYEAHDAITTTGAGIMISRRTAEVMEALGLNEEISRVSIKDPSSISGPRFRKSDIPEGGFEWFHHIVKPNHRPSMMHRRDFVDVVKQYIPSSCTVYFNKRLANYNRQSAGSFTLHFTDGSTATTDVLIGADGIRSSVRKTLFETIDRDLVDPSKIRQYTDASWTGTLHYRSVFPVEKLSEIDPNNVALKNFVIFCGKGKHIASYPILGGTMINVAIYVVDKQKIATPFDGRWISEVPREEVEKAFEEFEPALKNLLKCLEKPLRWALHVVNELPLSVCDKVVLIGDACHAMTPYLGAGAGQAIEDAFVLGRLLAHPLTTLDNVHTALKAYQDVRLPFAQFAARESERSGYMYQLDAPRQYDDTDGGNEQEEPLHILKEKILGIVGEEGWESEDNGPIAGWLQAEKKLEEMYVCAVGASENHDDSVAATIVTIT